MLTRAIWLILFLLLSSCVQMEEEQKVEPKTPKEEYTAEDAGEWESIKEDHLPIVELDPKEGVVNVWLNPKKFNPNHYIERIGIMNQDKVDLVSKPFGRQEEPRVSFVLKPFPSDLERTKIYVKCNLHDLWTVTLAEVISQKKKLKY